MKKFLPTPQQVRATLDRSRAQLAYIVRRSEEAAPGSAHIDRARVGELTGIVIHAVLSLHALPNGAAHRTLIARAYAKGVGSAPHTPTLTSVRTIIAVITQAIAELAGDGAPSSQCHPWASCGREVKAPLADP